MAADAGVIGHRMATAPKANQHKNEESRPAHEQHAHEPLAELQDVIDLKAVFGKVRGLPEKFVDQCEAIHTCSSLRRSAPDKARPAFGHDAKCENQTRRSRRAQS